MVPPSRTLESAGHSRQRFTIRIQRFTAASLDWLARKIRRGHTSADTDDAVAVVCNAFLRYACLQAAGIAQGTNNRVVLYYVDRLDDFGGDADERTAYLRAAESAGVRCVPLPRRRLRRLFVDTRSLHRSLRSERPRTVIVQAHVDPRFAFLGFAFPVTTFVHDPVVHSGDHESTFPLPLRMIARFSEATAAATLVHSETFIDQLNPWIDRRQVGVVPHGANIAPRPVPAPTAPRLVMVGRLMTYKGAHVALDAFRIVRQERPDCTLTLAGRGTVANEVRARHEEAVELIDGYVPEQELETLLDSASIILLPYLDASQSGVGLLAVARGIPCIVSQTGALPDLVPPKHAAQVVPPGDAEALATAILTTLDHDDAHRVETRDHAAQRFSWDRVGPHALREIARVTA